MDETAEQMERRYIADFGQNLGEVLYELRQHLTWLHLKWNEYVELFGKDEARIEKLNSAAKGFFGMVQDAWWDDILLHISRLTDSRTDVLTVHRLAKLTKVALRDDIRRHLADIDGAVAFARDWRDRRIAHANLDLIRGRASTPLSEASRLAVKNALAAIDALVDFVDAHYTGSEPTYYEHLNALGGAGAIWYHVQHSLKARDDDRAAARPLTRFPD